MFALGAQHAPTKAVRDEHMEFAKGFGEFCYEMYHRNPTGLAGQHVFVNDQNDFTPPSESNNRFFALRPETVETLFYLYRFTNDTKYRDWGWEIFESINKYCRNENGYAGLRDVTEENSQQDDKQQSWFLAETLKYLYLLFSPHEYIPLDKYVFNTEAHPIHIFDLKKKPQ
jgi:mannosyl-oligosaccharide alpha-1,2-mannosidase